MAIHNELKDRINDINTAWQDKSGLQVEDFICQSISDLTKNDIVSMQYVGTDLILTKGNGDQIKTEVTPVPPSYDYGIKIFGLKVGNLSYTSGNITISNSSTIKLLVGAYGTIKLTGDPEDKGGQVNVVITYESNNTKTTLSTKLGLLSKNSFEFNQNGDILKLKDGISPIEIDLNKDDQNTLFSSYLQNGIIKIKLIPNENEQVDVIETELSDLGITCEIPTLTFDSKLYYTFSSNVNFSLSGGTTKNYKLTGFNNGTQIADLSNLSYILLPGLNQLVIRAQNRNNTNIVSDWLIVDLICADNCKETVIAVNKVNNGIINNGVAELYHLTVYSPNKEELILNNYLDDFENHNQGENLIKKEIINSYSYDNNNIYTVNYKKYIEESSSGSKFLKININNQKDYVFYIFDNNELQSNPFKKMDVEEPNVNFMYYNNSIKYSYDQIVGQNNEIFTIENLNPNLESTDGWGETEGICYFRVTAQTEPVFKSDLNLDLKPTGFSIELGFKTYNISNKSKPILTIGKLLLWPTLVVWWDSNDSAGEKSDTFTTRNSQFLEGVDTHVMITVYPNYSISLNDPYFANFLKGDLNKYNENSKTYKVNIVKIYINGCIDRSFVLNNSELEDLMNSTLNINPTTSDIDFYLLRIYNTVGLSDDIVLKNFNSFIFDKSEKQKFYDKNDITENINGYKVISFAKARKKLNTIVLVLPKDLSFPNCTWDDDMEEFAKENPATMFIGYADSVLNQQYGGRITNGQIKGQGTSAKRYLIWNVLNSFGKYKDDGKDSIFTSYSYDNFDSDINKFKTTATATTENYYIMPTYEGQVDNASYVKKSVGKVNWASSMQSHKIGACKLYEDAYKAKYPDTIGKIGKKAVHEEPFLYFYWETDLKDVSNIELADVLNAGSSVKFAGFQTWGAGKGDKFESGYGDDTPEYLMLEGGENASVTVNFGCPWHALQTVDSNGNVNTTPTISKDDSINNPTLGLKIEDDSIIYKKQGAWDIDFGCHDNGDRFLPEVQTSLKRFREFYDFVYKYDFTFKVMSGLSVDSKSFTMTDKKGKTVPDTEYKYVILSNNFYINGSLYTDHKSGDVYRYDVLLETWVPAGLYYNNGTWERYNLYESYSGSSIDSIRSRMKTIFTEEIINFIDVNDIAFHQAFIKFVSGTDNRAKNTYFLIIGPKYIEVGEDLYERPEIAEDDWSDYKIRLIGDDLDTIFATDNAGLLSKPYNLLEASYDSSFKSHWGDSHNIFFDMFDNCFESNIIDNLKSIIDKAFNGKSIDNKESYFYKNFFKIQEDYPEVAYNHTSRLYYENAYVIMNTDSIESYENNLGIDPIGLIHGACLESEKQFMRERLDFLNGYALTNLTGWYSTSGGKGGSSTSPMNVILEFTPYQDFYPNYGYGAQGEGDAVPYYVLPSSKGKIIATQSLAKKDELIKTTISKSEANTYLGIFQMPLYKTLNILGSTNTTLPDLERGTELCVDNKNETDTILKFKLETFSGLYPVLEKLELKSVELPSTLSLSQCPKLKTIDLTNSITQEVILPMSGRLLNVILPSSIKKFEILNNPGLTNVSFEGYDNIESVYINCDKCGNFDVADFCEKIKNSPLKSITIKNANFAITEEALKALLNAENVDITGKITILNKIGDTEPKEISFETKQLLVNIFGNIDTGSNGLIFIYTKSTSRPNITYPDLINAYYDDNLGGILEKGNLFVITINNNNVNIIEGENPQNSNINYRLDIKYELLLGDSNEININSITGNITLNKKPTIYASAKITINDKYYNEQPISINYEWTAPLIGYFAYADGSFSKTYIKSKKLLGIIYDKLGNETQGDLYILGTLLTNNSSFVGYLTSDTWDTSGIYTKIPGFVDTIVKYLRMQSTNGLNIETELFTDVDKVITYDSRDTIKNYKSFGKSDTYKYVTFVNKNVLPVLYEDSAIPDVKNYITEDSNGNYLISNISNLNKICEIINKKLLLTESGYEYLNASILFPYFYSAWLYNVESDYYTGEEGKGPKLQWYAPSAHDWSKIIYLYGYSISGSTFNEANQTVIFSGNLSSNFSDDNYTDNFNTPIFALANKQMTSYYPTVWKNIMKNNNKFIITTSRSLELDNYGYIERGEYTSSYNTILKASWLAGLFTTHELGSTLDTSLWGYTERQGGLPFTVIPYNKP